MNDFYAMRYWKNGHYKAMERKIVVNKKSGSVELNRHGSIGAEPRCHSKEVEFTLLVLQQSVALPYAWTQGSLGYV